MCSVDEYRYLSTITIMGPVEISNFSAKPLQTTCFPKHCKILFLLWTFLADTEVLPFHRLGALCDNNVYFKLCK